MRWGFEQVGDCRSQRDFFVTNHDLVFIIAELTFPDLFTILFCEDTHLVEYCLANCANLSVSGCQLAFVGEDIEGNLEDIGIKLLSVDMGFGCTARTFVYLMRAPNATLLGSIFLVTKIETTTKII